MSILVWIVLGLVAGFIGNRIVGRGGSGFLGDIAVGIAGALIGGAVFGYFGEAGVSGLNLWSLAVAVVGSVLLLAAFYAIRGPARA